MRFVHVINPFKCDSENASYLYYAQPITFESMLSAQQFTLQKTPHITVDLCSVNFPEDDEIVPDYFHKLSHLERSTATEYPTLTNRKLPFIQDILQTAYYTCQNKSDNDEKCFIIFTNSDIGVQKEFYIEVASLIEENRLDALVINRRDNIPKFHPQDGHRLTEKDLDFIYTQKGSEHCGKDCFIFKSELMKKIDMKNLFIGYPPWGYTLSSQLEKYSIHYEWFKNLFLTFHLGCDQNWANHNAQHSILWQQNIKNAQSF